MATTRIENMSHLRRDLAKIDKALGRDFTKGLREAAKLVSDAARRSAKRGSKRSEGRRGRRAYSRVDARRGTAQQRKMATGIKPVASAKEAAIVVRDSAKKPGAQGAFMGSGQFRQFPPWVGRRFNIDAPGQGPYLLGEAWRDKKPEAAEAALSVVREATSKLESLRS